MNDTITTTERKLLKQLVGVSRAGYFKTGQDNRTIINHTKQINLEAIRISREDRQRKLEQSPKDSIIKMSKLITIIANQFTVSVDQLRGHSRKRFLVIPRQIFCYIAYMQIGLTYREIGAFLNGRDHTTVLYSIHEGVPSLVFNDKKLKRRIEYITKLFNVQKYEASEGTINRV